MYGVIQLKFRSRAKDSTEITSIYKEIICQAYTLAFNGDHSSTIFRMAFFIQSQTHVSLPRGRPRWPWIVSETRRSMEMSVGCTRACMYV